MLDNHRIADNLKMICPRIKKFIQVRDDWYPSYCKDGKLFVLCVMDVGYDKWESKFYVHITFFGKDDFGLEKYLLYDNPEEVINTYRQFKKYTKKLRRNTNLKHILYKDGYVTF